MKKIALVFLIALILSGCMPAAFVAGTTVGTVVHDHRSTKTMIDDRDVTYTVQYKLDNDPELSTKAHLSIATFNHIALLVGQAPDAQLRNQAEAIAKANSKVKMVYNEITIEKPSSDMARANDTWITTKVKTVLAATPSLNSSTLKIVTENKVVYLMGLTTRSQANLATEKTRTVAGVKKVVKLFEYVS